MEKICLLWTKGGSPEFWADTTKRLLERQAGPRVVRLEGALAGDDPTKEPAALARIAGACRAAGGQLVVITPSTWESMAQASHPARIFRAMWIQFELMTLELPMEAENV
jgi:hypothetical protein